MISNSMKIHHYLTERASCHTYNSSATDLPLDVLDANLLVSLVVVVIPLALRQIDGGERGVGLEALGFKLALVTVLR